MAIWSAEIKELEYLYESFKGQLPDLEKELAQLIQTEDANVIMLYSRRCLEVIITDLCECELRRPRKTEPLKGIIDKLHKEEKIPAHIITSMHGLNDLSTYGTHPKDFDPKQVKPVLINLDIIIKWYLKYKDSGGTFKQKAEAERHDTGFSEISKAEKSIAVLPFVNMSPEKNQDYFCDGITEEIINALAHIESFKVIARTSAFAFKDKHVDIREIGRMLDVETLLEGSIRKADNKLRITAQLIKVADGSHIWSERYDREIKDVFVIQDEISLAIVENLKVKLLGETETMIAKRHTENLEAYNFYLKGIYCYQMLTVEGFEKASGYFKQALLKDPDYALAYAGLGYVNWLSTMWGKNVPPDEAYPKANEYVTKAMKIDGTLAEPYSLLATINTFYYWNWKEAEQNFKNALQINPNSSMIHTNYSIMLIFTRRYDEAISEAKRAKELDPLSYFVNTRAGMIFLFAGHYDRAIEEYQMALTLNPNFFFTHFNLGNAYLSKKMFKEAVAEYKKAVDLSNGIPTSIAMLGLVYYQIGKKDQAEKLFDSLKKRSETEYVPATCFYLFYKLRGDDDLALEWLKRACNEHDSFLPWYRASPELIPEGSKYMKLLLEMGLDY
jgi:TolB-like protein/Tfp pilus assembly protein PilF